MTSLPSSSAGRLAVHLRRLNEDGRLACIVRGPGGRLCGLANLRNLTEQAAPRQRIMTGLWSTLMVNRRSSLSNQTFCLVGATGFEPVTPRL